jgi:hypothetical protein
MAVRPSPDWKSAITVLMSSLELGSRIDALIADRLATASLMVPQRPFGSAAETAMPVRTGLSNILIHSSGVKLCLLAMVVS